MKALFKNTALAIALSLTALGGTAQETAIKGYFRVQTLAGSENGNQNYVEVTGPFTAKPNLTYKEAVKSAGSIIYVEAVKDGDRDSYRLTSLRSQGIDVAKDIVDAEDYEEILFDALSGSDAVYGLMRQGFKYGYTSIARATVGTVFMFVASRLGGYNKENDGYTNDDFYNVAVDFNKNVTAKLDLGIRLIPVEGKENAYQLFFDVPNLQIVCDWYKDPTNPERTAVFASAMKAMTNFLADFDVNLETFYPSDIKQFNKWGYDVTKFQQPGEDGNIVTTFDEIFSDADMLFNWIKWVGCNVLDPAGDESGRFQALVDRIGVGDMIGKVHNHYLTDLLVSYLPRLHPNTRIFLINGRVYNDDGNVSTGGSHWDAAGNSFGFANEREVALAGANGIFVMNAVDNENQEFIPELPHAANAHHDGEEMLDYSGFIFDFPVSMADEHTRFLTINEEQITTADNFTVTYVEFVELPGIVPAGTPFIIENADTEGTPTSVKLIVGGNDSKRKAGMLAEAGETVTTNANLKGVLLTTPMDATSLQNYWGDEIPSTNIYPLGTQDFKTDNTTRLTFKEDSSKSTLNANEIVYVPEYPIEHNLVLVDKPTPAEVEELRDTTTGVESVVNDSESIKDNSFYDLRGIKVARPQSGNIYIHRGKKVLVL